MELRLAASLKVAAGANGAKPYLEAEEFVHDLKIVEAALLQMAPTVLPR